MTKEEWIGKEAVLVDLNITVGEKVEFQGDHRNMEEKGCIKLNKDFLHRFTTTDQWKTIPHLPVKKPKWNIYYKVYFWTIKENSLIWLQYRLLFRILGTRSYLYKIKIADSYLCGLCGSECEKIVHIFTECFSKT